MNKKNFKLPKSKFKRSSYELAIEEGKRMIARLSPEKEADFVLQANDLIENIEMEAAENGKLIDGTREMLHELKKRGIKLLDCSSILYFIQRLNIHHFATIIRKFTRF